MFGFEAETHALEVDLKKESMTPGNVRTKNTITIPSDAYAQAFAGSIPDISSKVTKTASKT